MAADLALSAPRLNFESDADVQEHFHASGWSDGLPIVASGATQQMHSHARAHPDPEEYHRIRAALSSSLGNGLDVRVNQSRHEVEGLRENLSFEKFHS